MLKRLGKFPKVVNSKMYYLEIKSPPPYIKRLYFNIGEINTPPPYIKRLYFNIGEINTPPPYIKRLYFNIGEINTPPPYIKVEKDTMGKQKLVNEFLGISYILFGMYLTKYQNLRIGFQAYFKNIP